MNEIEVAKSLLENQVGVIATDTVYGVVARLKSPEAVHRIYDVKQRDKDKPVGTILIASPEQLKGISISHLVAVASQYWPGPTSVVLPVHDELVYAHRGLGSLPFRVPDDTRLQQLLQLTGPLATSSANLQGKEPAASIAEAQAYFGNSVDFYCDSGTLVNRRASKIISIDKDGVQTIIRA